MAQPNPTPVTTKEKDFASIVKKAEGEDANKQEVVYLFSNNREFKSTDADVNSGLYPK